MTKTFVTLTALGALMISPALAQTTTSPSPASPPAMSAPEKSPAPEHSSAATPTPAPSATTGSASASASAKPSPVDSQTPDQFLASSFKGTDVVGADGKKIGDVNDILFEKDGSIKAYVVGVGGFLGIGAKSVAFSPNSFEVVPGKSPSDTKLKLSMNKDELKAASTFQPYKPASTASTTGSSTGMSPRPAGTVRH